MGRPRKWSKDEEIGLVWGNEWIFIFFKICSSVDFARNSVQRLAWLTSWLSLGESGGGGLVN